MRKSRRFCTNPKPLFLSFALLAALGCRTRSYNVKSKPESARIARQLVQKYDGFAQGGELKEYGKVDLLSFSKNVLPQFGRSGELLSESHSATKLLQAFVHRIHEALKKEIPAVQSIPEPRIGILQNSTVNAFAFPTVVCVPLRVVSNKAVDASNSTQQWLVVQDGVLQPASVAEELSVKGSDCPASFETRPELIPHIVDSIKQRNPQCRPDYQNNALVMSHECLNEIGIGPNIEGVLHIVQGAGLLVFSGLVKSLEEQHVQAVIAHELAHYYMRHSVIEKDDGKRLGYFYRIPDYTNRNARPLRDESGNLKELAEALKTVSPFISRQIEGLSYHSETTFGVIRLCSDLRAMTEIAKTKFPDEWDSPCKKIRAAYKAIDKLNVFGSSPPSIFQGQSLRQFRELDNAAVEVVQVVSKKTIGEIVVLLRSDLNSDQVIKETLNKWLTLKNGTDSKKSAPLQDGQRMSEVVAAFNAQVIARDSKTKTLAKTARDIGLGWYTSEVEADEIAAYLLAIGGYSPKQLPDAFFVLAALRETNAFSPSVEECKKAYLNNWNHWTFNSQPWVPFFGSPEVLHPALCFRIYNSDMEISGAKLPAGVYTRSSDEWRLMKSTI